MKLYLQGLARVDSLTQITQVKALLTNIAQKSILAYGDDEYQNFQLTKNEITEDKLYLELSSLLHPQAFNTLLLYRGSELVAYIKFNYLVNTNQADTFKFKIAIQVKTLLIEFVHSFLDNHVLEDHNNIITADNSKLSILLKEIQRIKIVENEVPNLYEPIALNPTLNTKSILRHRGYDFLFEYSLTELQYTNIQTKEVTKIKGSKIEKVFSEYYIDDGIIYSLVDTTKLTEVNSFQKYHNVEDYLGTTNSIVIQNDGKIIYANSDIKALLDVIGYYFEDLLFIDKEVLVERIGDSYIFYSICKTLSFDNVGYFRYIGNFEFLVQINNLFYLINLYTGNVESNSDVSLLLLSRLISLGHSNLMFGRRCYAIESGNLINVGI